jgi:hypothetical protein
VADGWCWFVLREEYYWLVAGGCERKILLAGATYSGLWKKVLLDRFRFFPVWLWVVARRVTTHDTTPSFLFKLLLDWMLNCDSYIFL